MKQLFYLVLLTQILAGCIPKADVQQVTGTVPVQVAAFDNEQNYHVQVVSLEGITNLSAVGGDYAQFYYSPGSTATQLTGLPPKAQFIKSKAAFIPTDLLTLQMTTIYYHMQKLAGWDRLVGAADVNTWPRSIGLETIVLDTNPLIRRNNAFYNGPTDSMMFVPFDRKDMPISLNAGIIAHEHFHSLFYKIVLVPALKLGKITSAQLNLHVLEASSSAEPVVAEPVAIEPVVAVSNDPSAPQLTIEEARLYNETLLRGLNEGLADYWGWLYTEDSNFMKYSLPGYVDDRTLDLPDFRIGKFRKHNLILSEVKFALNSFSKNEDRRIYLNDYAYRIGTDYARFMRQWTDLKVQSVTDQWALGKDAVQNRAAQLVEVKKQAKVAIGQQLIYFLKDTSVQIQNSKDTEVVSAAQIFKHFAATEKDQKMCQFVKAYLDFAEVNTEGLCESESVR